MAAVLDHRVDGPDDANTESVVLIGSLGSDRTMWEPQYSALCDELHVITADLRGHGRSPAPAGPYRIADLAGDVLSLIDHAAPVGPRANGAPVHLVGLSLGGAVAQWIAAHHPRRIRSLTVLCTSARFGESRPWHDRAAAVRRNGTASIAESVVDRWFTPALARRDPDLVGRSRAMVAATPDEGYAACCEALAGWDGRADLPHIAAPTLVIGGAQDPATGPEHLRAIAEGIPSAELRILDPGAHLANIEQADKVNDLIRTHARAAGSATAS